MTLIGRLFLLGASAIFTYDIYILFLKEQNLGKNYFLWLLLAFLTLMLIADLCLIFSKNISKELNDRWAYIKAAGVLGLIGACFVNGINWQALYEAGVGDPGAVQNILLPGSFFVFPEPMFLLAALAAFIFALLFLSASVPGFFNNILVYPKTFFGLGILVFGLGTLASFVMMFIFIFKDLVNQHFALSNIFYAATKVLFPLISLVICVICHKLLELMAAKSR